MELLFRGGELVFRDGNLIFVNEGEAADCVCCNLIDPLPACESYPLQWTANINFGYDRNSGHAFFMSSPAIDPDNRIMCGPVADRAVYGAADFQAVNGSHVLVYSTGSTYAWSKGGLPFLQWLDPDFSSTARTSITLSVAITGCTTGPGTVNIQATCSSPHIGGSTIATWSGSKVLSAGQQLRNAGSVAMTATNLSSTIGGYDYPINAGCTGFNFPASGTPTLTLVPG